MVPLVYIAGPYTRPDPAANTERALAVCDAMLDTGAVAPVCPHLSHFQHARRPRGIEEWYAIDLRLLDHCHALYRLAGASRGADIEVRRAERMEIPIFTPAADHDLSMLKTLVEWAGRWEAPPRFAHEVAAPTLIDAIRAVVAFMEGEFTYADVLDELRRRDDEHRYAQEKQVRNALTRLRDQGAVEMTVRGASKRPSVFRAKGDAA